jgi:hypothetical protein
MSVSDSRKTTVPAIRFDGVNRGQTAIALAARLALRQALGANARSPGGRLELELKLHGGREHLPIVTLKRVA